MSHFGLKRFIEVKISKYYYKHILLTSWRSILIICRNSAVFYWKYTNLIGSPIVLCTLIEHDQERVALRKRKCFLIFGLKVHNIVVGLELQFFRVSTQKQLDYMSSRFLWPS